MASDEANNGYGGCRYPDYVSTDSGLQYKDLRDGSGDTAKDGSHVTIDWDGYTLGYYGRPFEARNKVSHQAGQLKPLGFVSACQTHISIAHTFFLTLHVMSTCRLHLAVLMHMSLRMHVVIAVQGWSFCR